MDIVETYNKIWEKADELAEKETLQFLQNPYKKSRETNEGIRYYTLTRSEYKNRARLRHICAMMEMLTLGEKND